MRLLPEKIFDEKQVIVLDKSRKKITKRQTSNFYQILPFTTGKSDSIKNALSDWEKEIGAYSRRLLNVELSAKSFNTDYLLEGVLERVENQPEHEDEIHTFFSELLLQRDGGLNVTHPSMFMYIQGNPATKKKLGTFLADLTQHALDEGEIEKIKQVFKAGQNETLLDKMIVNLLPSLTNKEYKAEHALYSSLPIKLLGEDFVYLAEHPQYFLKEINNLLKYYLHYIVSQTTVKINNFETSNWNHPSKMYYTIHNETTVTSRRKTMNSGMGLLTSASENLFVHELTMAQLSCNSVNQSLENEKSKIMTYDEIFQHFTMLSDTDQVQFLKDIDLQTERILTYAGLESNVNDSQTFNEAAKQLFNAMKLTTPKEAQSRYGDHAKNIAKSHFTKRRGRLGYVLSLNQEMLILMCAVSCKNDRITFVELLERLSKRGINFDNESSTALLQLLEKINVIDKKSDSGEAQYVKPIL
ncbi:DNA phosphorothioation-dependent restriction protein DptG [Exiguobacterium sp. AT1b]|uniref:DNA phosphorothioation-dependent restriction protein DptG n=1 Tax=Exiguobacterium sp. (strain ATCC BAA-1283 / AT1b) TaxID=360911 RepID=C4L4E0_EXISA|nr:DNA phosphorothioation-dependent restriction protein DptG [Exiguobacterium sp. AT1b]ACQ71503.1 hypothetical protein EAT1b_2586 [Exiguobacterium sp. AT1b]